MIQKATFTFLNSSGMGLAQRGFRYKYNILDKIDQIKKQVLHEPDPLNSYKVNLVVTECGEKDEDVKLYETDFKL